MVTVTAKGQVTVPKALRDTMCIVSGNRLDFELIESGVLQVRVLARGADNLFGLVYHRDQPSVSGEAMDEGIAQAVATRHRLP